MASVVKKNAIICGIKHDCLFVTSYEPPDKTEVGVFSFACPCSTDILLKDEN